MKAFGGDLAPVPAQVSWLHEALIALTVIAFVLVAWIQGPGREFMARDRQFALFVHLYNGLYVDSWVERLAFRLWPEKVGRTATNTASALTRKATGIES